MFKSVFAKYVTAFMVIITFGFALLLLIVTSIVGNYTLESGRRVAESTARVAETDVESEIASLSSEAFADWMRGDAAESTRMLLRTLTERDGVSIAVADAAGTVLYTAESGHDAASAESRLPESVTSAAGRDVIAVEGHDATYAVGLYNRDGSLCGIAAVSLSEARLDGTMTDLYKTVITSALLVLLAAMIAAYFITERTVAPLRQMSTAARDFAAGKFDSRVIVRGEDEVARLAASFNSMAESLESLENMRNSFIANVSHDLRTPMTTIAGFIDGIRDGVIPPEERDHYLEVVSIEVRRLSRLVSSLLDLSRIQAGDRKFVKKPFDICEMARLILISFERQIDEKRLEVEFDCEDDRMTVTADRDAIYQIFYNICHNAVKFSREGGALRIRICTNKDKKTQISVYNDGEGIPSADLPMVFERFYKSDKSRGLDRSGVGLGLFIAKTIISAHGERIWVESEEGRYCEFFFTLPRSHGILRMSEDKSRTNSTN